MCKRLRCFVAPPLSGMDELLKNPQNNILTETNFPVYNAKKMLYEK